MKRQPIHLHIVPEKGKSFPAYPTTVCLTVAFAKQAAEKFYQSAVIKPKAVIIKRANGQCPAVMMDGSWLNAN